MSGSQRSPLHVAVVGPMTLGLLPLDEAQTPSLPAGYPAPIVSSIVRGYVSRGMRVSAVTTSVGISSVLTFIHGPLTVTVVPRTGARSALTMFRTERAWIRDVLQSLKPDVVHAQWTYEFAAAGLDSGIPTLVTVRDNAVKIALMSRSPYRALRLLLDRSVRRRVRYLSATSPYLADLLPRRGKTVRVIHNFCDRQLVPSGGRHTERKLVTVSNGFGGWKNVASGVRAFALSTAAANGWTYELIGDELGPGGPAEAWAIQHGIDAGVRFKDRTSYPETLGEISRAYAMIHPSLEESFGMTVLEAMSLGVPVIGGSTSGNVPYLLRDGAGAVCDVRDPRSIAHEIDRLVGDPALRDTMGAKASDAVGDRYSAESALDSYCDYLQEMVMEAKAR